MKPFFKTLFCLLFIGIVTLNSQAQTSERSTDIETISGQKVFVHTVKAGETIYNLCKLYNCTEQELKQLNPGSLVSGITVDQKLMFPYSEPIKSRTFSGTPTTHTVDKGETMYGISKKYGITISELLSKNPSLTDGIKTGQVLIIPVISNSGSQNQAIAKPNTNETKSVKKEALFPPQQALKTDTSKAITVVSNKSICDSLLSSSKNRMANIAIVVPFCVQANDSVSKSNAALGKDDRIYGKSLPYLEFYEGILLALDSLKRLGYSFQIFTYDSQKDSLGIESILKELATKKIDLIIGSNDQDEFEKLATFAKKRAIPIVSPLSTNLILAANNPQVFLANTPLKCRIQAEAQYSISLKKNNYVIIHAGHINEIENIEKIKQFMLPTYGGDTAKLNKHVKVVKFSTYSMTKIEKSMDSGLNIVIIPSEDQAFINDVVTKLNNYKRRYQMELHGMAMWENFKNLELDDLFDMHFKCATSTFRDYSDPKVKRFIINYREIFKNEPGKLSFLGYDIMMYFGALSAKYGKNIAECGSKEKYTGIQNSFTFSSMGKGAGFFNSYVNILTYTSDYKRSIIPININVKASQIEPSEKKPIVKPHSTEEEEESASE
jgi:LysM repeat protein/ABC-type branched-subunit amino acid transport system substrate-binding protein